MLDTSELSPESQAEFAEMTSAAGEFFDCIERLDRELAQLKQPVASLTSNVIALESEHA